MGASSTEEFPLLSALGLYAADIRGDGNCLFNALSDQLYGHQNEHAAIRSRVIEYMREHAAYYKQFIDVHPGGGIRRNPKRKNAGAYSSPASMDAPTSADIDRVFESHLQSMARGGTYGDNMEITAFSSAFNVDIKIYQRDFAYMVTGSADDVHQRQVAHIAYHTWEHYSSIRNLDGPHTGSPQVSPQVLSPEEEAKQKAKLHETPHVLPWQIDVVSKSLPYLADKPTIKRALEAARGDVNLAVSNLLDAEEYGSASSQPGSSSVERDQDSDDDVHSGPNKKQDRRMSRASKAHRPRTTQPLPTAYSGSQESISSSWDSEDSSSLPGGSQQSTTTAPSASQSAEPEIKKPVKLKLLPPRPPPPPGKTPPPSGKTSQRQPGPRVSARDRKDIKKQAQKAARKERQLEQAGLTTSIKHRETPPVETLRTLYI